MKDETKILPKLEDICEDGMARRVPQTDRMYRCVAPYECPDQLELPFDGKCYCMKIYDKGGAKQ